MFFVQDDNVEVQLDAVNSLDTIALALGPQRTVADLFPALDKYCFPVEIQAARSPEAYSNTDALAAKEEVLAAIAEQLKPPFIDYVGGSKAAAKTILPLLEKLAMVEETVIRNCAVTSLNSVMEKMKPDDVKESGLPILKNLSSADWFTSRVSASYLTCTLYKILTSEQVNKIQNKNFLFFILFFFTFCFRDLFFCRLRNCVFLLCFLFLLFLSFLLVLLLLSILLGTTNYFKDT